MTIVKTKFGFCQVSPCGTNGFCATSHNATCVVVNETFSECKCKEGYTSHEDDYLYQCCYKQKSAFTAFLLEVFIGFGAGHFYIGNMLLGLMKAFIYAILFVSTIIICTNRLRLEGVSESSFLVKMCRTLCFLVCGCTYVGWQMIDSVLFSLGGYYDHNNMPLY